MKQHLRAGLAGLLALLLATPAAAQVNLNNLPSQTVVGRASATTGPAQAVPFTTIATLAGCETAGAFVVGIGSTSGGQCSYIAGSQALLNGGPLTINTTANTLTAGLNITQSGPNSGTTAGPFSFNLITVEDNNNILTGGRDPFDLLGNVSSAFRVNSTMNGSNDNIRIGGTFATNWTGNNALAETVGVIGSTYSNTTVGALWGNIGYSSIGPAGSTAALIPFAAEVSAQTGSTVARRTGYIVITEAPVQGSTLDAAFVVTAQNVGHGTPAGFKNVISISNTWFSATALDTTANFFSADSATSITNWANMSNVTVVGNIMLFPNLNIPGVAAGFTLAPHVANAFQYGGTNATGVQIEIDTFTGPSLFVGKRANTSSTAPSAVQANELIASLSAQPHDGTGYFETAGIGLRASQNQTGAAHGSYITFITTPTGSTSTAEVARIGPSGALLVGTTTDAAAGVVNVATGYRIANAAASGNVLRGNGTNFVSATLAVGDISGFGTGVATALATNVGTAGSFVVNGGALGSPSSAGTLPAHTLGGTISGGGNQINNVIIGTSNPLAGAFTTLTASTSGTFGNTTSPDSTLVVNNNNGAPDAVTFGAAVAHFVSADTTLSGIYLDNYGTGGAAQGYFAGRLAGGTRGSKSATTSNQTLFSFFGQGYTGSAYVTTAAVDFWNFNSPSGSDRSGFVTVRTTPSGSTTLTEIARFHTSGGLSIGTTTDPGIGTISANVKFTAAGNAGLSATKTVRASGGAADCTLIYTGGILTGGTC